MKIFIIYIGLILYSFSAEDDPANKLYIKAYDFVLEENWDEAISTFKQLIKEFPKSIFFDDAHFWIAYAKNEKGELEEAFDLYGKFIEDFKDSNLADDATRSRIKIAKKLYQQGKDKYREFVNSSGSTERSLEEVTLQKEVIHSLYKKGGSDEINSLKRIALSDNYSISVRKEAIYYFFKSKDHGDIEKIGKEFFAAIRDISLRKEIIYHMSKTESKKASNFLTYVACNENEVISIRKEAIFYLYKLNDFDALKSAYLLIQEDDLNKEIIHHFYKMNTKKSINFLIKILKLKTTSLALKKDIIYYLGRLNSTEARKAINDLVN